MKNGFFLITVLVASHFTTACSKSMKARTGLDGRKTQVTYTTVVQDETKLPVCDAGAQGVNAYLSASDSFVKCRGFAWQAARPGDTTGKYSGRSPVRYNEWIDSKLGHRWSVNSSRELSIDNISANACQKGWKLPTETELRQASLNGLFDGVKAHGGVSFDKAWTAEKKALRGLSRAAWEDPRLNASDKDMTAGVYCVRPA